MLKRYLKLFGEDQIISFLEGNEQKLKPAIRVNSLRISKDALYKRLKSKGFELKQVPVVSNAFYVTKAPFSIGATTEYLLGYYYIQNVASMIPSLVLNPTSQDIVVDMCAAPGGKATHLAQIMNNEGNLILIERNQKRIASLETNLLRMGITNSIIINDDAVNLPKIKIKADRILLDAPCTGEGLIRQDPSRKKSKQMRDINKMSIIQKNLLASGLNSLKPGGNLLYSTCSIAPEENEIVINEVLNSLSGYEIGQLQHAYGENGLTKVYGKSLRDDLKYSQRLYPHLHDTIGFYLCLIKKLQ